MSRIGKKPIAIPDGVTVRLDNGSVHVKGPKGELTYEMHPLVKIAQDDNVLLMSIEHEDNVEEKALWGTCAAIVTNMVKGVSEGFAKQLELNGVGFKWSVSGNTLKMSLGFSHEVEYTLPEGIEANIDKMTLTISGYDKQLVGQVASEIRGLKKPEPYKGKGIKYVDEHIRRKAGKQVAGSGAA